MSVPVFERVLLAVRNRPLAGWIAAICYALAVTFPHEQVQTVVNKIADAMGHPRFYFMMGAIILTVGAIFSVALVRALRRNSGRPTLVVFWLITLGLIVFTWKILTFNNSELVHYPQYFPLGVILVALTGSPLEAIAWVVISGGLDEAFQYAVLHGDWGVPFDFNDVYMDTLGAALGAVFALAFLPGKRATRRPALLVVVSLVVGGVILKALGLMQIYEVKTEPHWFALSRMTPHPFWFNDPTWGPHTTHILTPTEGPVLIVATLTLYAILERRSRTFVLS